MEELAEWARIRDFSQVMLGLIGLKNIFAELYNISGPAFYKLRTFSWK